MKIPRRAVVLLSLALVVVVSGNASATPSKKLYLFNWSEYMNPHIIKAFEKKYHVKVVRSFYDSNPELFAKLQAGGDSQYDVVFPSNYYVPRLIETGLIQPLNKSEIPNLDNLAAKFRNPSYDPHSKYTAAYQWGDTGIVYNTKDLSNAPKSWSILFDPKVNPKYPFAMVRDAQVMLGAACAYQGHGYDCTGRDNWKQAAKLILKTKQRSNFNSFIDGTPVLQRLARGTVDAGISFNGDYVYFKEKNRKGFANTKFIVPKEGTELWVDAMAIPTHAPHPKLANQFINFVLTAKMGAKLSNWTSYASPNKAAHDLLNPELQKPPVTPTDAQMKRLHFTPAIKSDPLQFVQQLWTEVQSR